MATVKKLIGRLPVYKGDWVAGAYSMLNQVSYLGSTFQSKIDNNTSQPATLVNNVLQVNSNWSVVSNGTAAYLADSRLTACETASTYAQAGVDTLRSNICGIYSTSFQTGISPSKNSTLCFWIKDSDTTSYPKSILSNLSGTADSGIVLRVNSKGIIDLKDFGSNLSQSINSDGRSFIAVSISDYTIDLYVNGEQKSMSISNSFINGLKYRFFDQVDGVRKFDGITNSIRVFNTYLTKDDIDALYNQGRCDEVVFGDEWKNAKTGELGNQSINVVKGLNCEITVETQAIQIPSNAAFYFIGLSKTATNSQLIYKPLSEFINTISVKRVSDISANDVRPTVFFSDINQKYISEINNSNSNAIKCNVIGVLNEYLPQYLTKTKWIDSGVNKQDIVLTSPTFTYVKPYKDVDFAEGAPTTNPVASGCMRIDRTNKRAYLSILK